MSRIGKKPIAVPGAVTVALENGVFKVEGPKGVLSCPVSSAVEVAINGSEIAVLKRNEDRTSDMMQGTTRAIIQNMIIGVQNGYEKKLELHGVGYVCNVNNNILTLRVGLANELKRPIPEGVTAVCPDQTHINISGCDKQKVGQFAAEIRSLRKPEPYKGKGIRYVGEQVKIKPGKSAKS